jgi:HK97 family phage major capsid protein
MAVTTRGLREDRAKIVADARAILDAAEAEKRDLTAVEQARWDVAMADVDKLGTRIAQMEKLDEIERGTEDRSVPRGDLDPSTAIKDAERIMREHQRTLAKFVRATEGSGKLEMRALQADDPETGGYLVQPMQFVARLIKAVDDAVIVRKYATVIPLTMAESLGAPSLDADPADADWTSEVATVSEDTSMDLGRRELTPHPVSKLVKLSRKLLRISAIPVENLVADRLAYKFGLTQEKGFLTGNGAGRPLGLFTASSQGISTSRDVSTDNTTTAITADGLINAFYALKEGYRRNARWLFHRDAVRNIRKLKGSDNNYLWQPGLAGGQPDSLLTRPIHESEWVPNTFTTGLYVGLVGDLSYYWIADSLAFELQRLVELYAATNQVGFIGRMESDGMPVLDEAFVRVKLA